MVRLLLALVLAAGVVGPAAAVAPPQVRAYADPAGTHRHKCPGCGFVWAHATGSFGRAADHTCVVCGRQSWYHYTGPDPPTERPPVRPPVKPKPAPKPVNPDPADPYPPLPDAIERAPDFRAFEPPLAAGPDFSAFPPVKFSAFHVVVLPPAPPPMTYAELAAKAAATGNPALLFVGVKPRRVSGFEVGYEAAPFDKFKEPCVVPFWRAPGGTPSDLVGHPDGLPPDMPDADLKAYVEEERPKTTRASVIQLPQSQFGCPT